MIINPPTIKGQLTYQLVKRKGFFFESSNHRQITYKIIYRTTYRMTTHRTISRLRKITKEIRPNPVINRQPGIIQHSPIIRNSPITQHLQIKGHSSATQHSPITQHSQITRHPAITRYFPTTSNRLLILPANSNQPVARQPIKAYHPIIRSLLLQQPLTTGRTTKACRQVFTIESNRTFANATIEST